jgi:hypothetical protein
MKLKSFEEKNFKDYQSSIYTYQSGKVTAQGSKGFTYDLGNNG